MTKCKLCDKPIYDGEYCGDCEQWLINRYDPTRGSPQSWDGGTLLVADIMKKLNCTRHEALMVLSRFGFQTNTYSGISLREFRFQCMQGDIGRFLERMKKNSAKMKKTDR